MTLKTAGNRVSEAAARERRRLVFINCPFDNAYQPALDMLILTVVCCGFLPTSAVERVGNATGRVLRIVERMREARLSIHDLSRYTGQGPDNLARFNMPLELGIAMEMMRASEGVESENSHTCFTLAHEGMPRDRVISDLNGYDVARYGDLVQLANYTWLWLAEMRSELGLPVPRVKKRHLIGEASNFQKQAEAHASSKYVGRGGFAGVLARERVEGFDARTAWSETVNLAKEYSKELQRHPESGS